VAPAPRRRINCHAPGFKKVNGVWLPSEIKLNRWVLEGKLAQSAKAEIEQADVNCDFKPEEFIYQPPYGSRVTHVKAAFSYRAGYNNPNAPLGQDKSSSPSATSDSDPPAVASRDPATRPAAGAPRPAGKPTPVKVRTVSTGSGNSVDSPSASSAWWALAAAVVVVAAIVLFVRRSRASA